MSRVKILELITLGEIGGAQTVLVDLVKGFTDGGYDVETDVVFGDGDYLPRALEQFRGNIIRTPNLTRRINLLKDFKALLQLIKLCREKKYDLVHCHSSKASWLGRLAAILAGIPRICVTVHGVSFRPGISPAARRIYRNIEKILLPLKAEYIFVAPSDMDEMIALGLDPAKCEVIPNGRPVPPRPEKGLRDLLPIKDGAPIVCMVGRLSEQKNPLSFIRVAKSVIEQYPGDSPAPYFVIVGDGPLHDECSKAIDRAGIADYVFLFGSAQDAGKFFWDADLTVLTSNYEACPLVAIEAMATGTPVIASNVGGTEHVIKHGETGYLFLLNHEQEAAQYVIELLKNKELRESMGRKALECYQSCFTVERMVEEYVKYFGLQKK